MQNLRNKQESCAHFKPNQMNHKKQSYFHRIRMIRLVMICGPPTRSIYHLGTVGVFYTRRRSWITLLVMQPPPCFLSYANFFFLRFKIGQFPNQISMSEIFQCHNRSFQLNCYILQNIGPVLTIRDFNHHGHRQLRLQSDLKLTARCVRC